MKRHLRVTNSQWFVLSDIAENPGRTIMDVTGGGQSGYARAHRLLSRGLVENRAESGSHAPYELHLTPMGREALEANRHVA